MSRGHWRRMMGELPTALARRGFHQAAAAADWSPADYASLDAWHRADDYSAGSWTDLSGNSRTLTQATGLFQPTVTTRAGQAALSFDGGDWLQKAYSSSLSGARTYYAVVEYTAVGDTRIFDGSGATDRHIGYTTATPQWGQYVTGAVTGGTPANGVIYGVCWVFNGASSAIYVNDFRAGQHVASGNPGSGSLAGLTCGATYLGTNQHVGYMWELLHASGAHDASTRALFGDYATARYTGLSVTT